MQIVFHNSCILELVFLSKGKRRFLNEAFPRRIFNDLAQMCQRDDVLVAYDNGGGVVMCNCTARSICVRQMYLANDRVALFAKRQNFTVRVRFARLLERDREKYQLRSFNVRRLFSRLPSQSFSHQFCAEELKSFWSRDRLTHVRCAFVGFNKVRVHTSLYLYNDGIGRIKAVTDIFVQAR